jgi:hypothetical protein
MIRIASVKFSCPRGQKSSPKNFCKTVYRERSMLFGMELGELQLPLLVVELVLLAFTLLIIVTTRGEFGARSELMAHVSSATDTITRQEYFATVIDSQAAERYFLATVTATPPTPEESAIVSMIVDSLSKASARGVNVRYMVPHSPDRLLMARRYKRAGAELRFHPGLVVSNARFMVVNDRTGSSGCPTGREETSPQRKDTTSLRRA